jgi:hypothetical protein
MSYGSDNSFNGGAGGGGFSATPSLGGLAAIFSGATNGYLQGQSAVYQRAMAQANLLRQQNVANSQMQYRQDRIAESDQARQLAAQKWAADPSNPSGTNYTDPQDANDRALVTSALAPVLDSVSKGAPPEVRTAIAGTQRVLLMNNPRALAMFDAATGGGPAPAPVTPSAVPIPGVTTPTPQSSAMMPPGMTASNGTSMPPAQAPTAPPPLALPPWVTASLTSPAKPTVGINTPTQSFAPGFNPVMPPSLPTNNIGVTLPMPSPVQGPPPAIPIPGSQPNSAPAPSSANSAPTYGNLAGIGSPNATPTPPPSSLLNFSIPPKALTPAEKSEINNRGMTQLLGMSDTSKAAAINNPAWRSTYAFTDADVPMLTNISKAPSGNEEQDWQKQVTTRLGALVNGSTGQQAHETIADLAFGKAHGYDTSFLPATPGAPNPNAPGGYNPRLPLTPEQKSQNASAAYTTVEAADKPQLDAATMKHLAAQDANYVSQQAIARAGLGLRGDELSLNQQRLGLDQQKTALAVKLGNNTLLNQVPANVKEQVGALRQQLSEASTLENQADQRKVTEINKGTSANQNVISSENTNILNAQATQKAVYAKLEALIPGSTTMSPAAVPLPTQRGTSAPGVTFRNPVTKQPVTVPIPTKTPQQAPQAKPISLPYIKGGF